jgi:hypothetical protein
VSPLAFHLSVTRPIFHTLSGFLTCGDTHSFHAGALKATNNRGLQPALDHLEENAENPVPDLSSVSSTTSSAPPPYGGGDPMDEDEDLEALKAVYGDGGGGSNLGQADAEAKVCLIYFELTFREAVVFFGFALMKSFLGDTVRALDAANAGRCLRTLPWRIITQRRAVTISLKSPPRRCVCAEFFLFLTKWLFRPY